jgi:hypothetical protein
MAGGMGEGPLKELDNLASFCQNRFLTTHSCMSDSCNRPPIPANSRRRRRLPPRSVWKPLKHVRKSPSSWPSARKEVVGRPEDSCFRRRSCSIKSQPHFETCNTSCVARKILGERQLTCTAIISNPGAFTRAWSRFELAPHRRLEWQICVATALGVHSDPWPVTFSPLPIESLRACPALAVSRS